MSTTRARLPSTSTSPSRRAGAGSGARGRGPGYSLQPAPHAPEEAGLDPETLLAPETKSLVHATLTGYGTNSEASRPGYDVTAFFGRSGLDLGGKGDGFVPMARPSRAITTEVSALFGAIMADRMAEKTGEGRVVETSLFETAVWTQATDYAITAVDKAQARQHAAQSADPQPGEPLHPCGDGKWIVISQSGKAAWPRFYKAIGQEAWLEKEEWIDQRSRFYAMADVVAAIDDVLA